MGRLVLRAGITLATTTLALLLADVVLDGLDAGSPAWPAALALSVTTAVTAPLIVRLALPLLVYTAGIASLALNALVVLVVDDVSDAISVDGFGTALLVSLIVTLVGTVVSWILALDDDATFTRAVIRRRIRKRGRRTHEPTTPGIVFFEIDGCSHGVLQRAVRAGCMPTVNRWIRSGAFALHPWETDLSSQTGASQAGLLMGSNDGIVAFRWFERDRQAIVVTGKPRDAAMLEQRLSTGSGLLAPDGASRNNLLSGDAASRQMTLSSVLERGGADRAWATYFSSADNVGRTLLDTVADLGREAVTSLTMRRRRVWPRLRKSLKYGLMRASTTVVMPNITVDSIVGDMAQGVPAIYATFVGYDEVAHHDGVERPSALHQLRRLDQQLRRIDLARRYAARPYELVVLSDHGQSQGPTFAQRYGESLEQVVRRISGSGQRVVARTSDEDSTAQLSGAVAELTHGDEFAERLTTEAGDAEHTVDESSLLVMASGNLGLVYVTGRPHRLTERELVEACPHLIDGLVAHPGIGLVVVATDTEGTVALGKTGRVRLRDGHVTGEDPTHPYGSNALRHLRRHDTFPHMPDLLLLSTWWPDLDEVAAFEELIGSHGGLGGEQSHPFVLAPSHLEWPSEPVVGAAAVHRVFRTWIARLQTLQPS